MHHRFSFFFLFIYEFVLWAENDEKKKIFLSYQAKEMEEQQIIESDNGFLL